MSDTSYYSHVAEAVVIRPYVVEVTFDNGVRRRIDLESRLWGPVFEPLRDPNYFARMFVSFGTIEWPNGADIAPETLYEIGELIEEPVGNRKT
jgi:hypothetical protein